jgi:signal transduction histidine kinase
MFRIGLRGRVFSTLTPLLLLLAVLGIAGSILLDRLSECIYVILRDYRSVIYMERLNEALERIDSSFQFSLARRPDKASQRYEPNWKIYEENLLREKANITVPGESELVERLSELTQAYRQQGNTFYSRRPGDPQRREDYYGADGLQDRFKQIKEVCGQIRRINQESMEETAWQGRQRAEASLAWFRLILIVAAILAGFFAWRTVKTIVAQLRAPIRDAADKLHVSLPAGSNVVELESALHQVAGQIGTLLTQVQDSQREVLRSEQLAAVGQMAAGLAHELRNPLMSMKLLVQPAAKGTASPNLSQRDLAVLDQEIERLEGSIQTFLDFARPPQLDKRPFEAQTVLQQTVALVSGRAEQQGVIIESQLPEEPLVIEADMGQFRQVLLNLLLNALDATAQGGSVAVHMRRSNAMSMGPDASANGGEELAECFILQVSDSGPGLPAEIAARIFEPFVSSKETGLGLGLSICKRIVEAHGGDIAAENGPRGGAVFTVRLPLRAKLIRADLACPSSSLVS